jgi:hypothetical protein
MEADWSVALGADDPVIFVPWAASAEDVRGCRFHDLRLDPGLIDEIEEARSRPGLRAALLLLNDGASHLWTAKCDAWTSSVDEGAEPYDRYEMDAEPGDTLFGAGSYVDLLPRDGALFSSFERQERWIRRVTERLRCAPGHAARVELVLRRAEVDSVPGFAVTWFVEGCGATAERATEAWGEAFHCALGVIVGGYSPDVTEAAPADGTMTEAGE